MLDYKLLLCPDFCREGAL